MVETLHLGIDNFVCSNAAESGSMELLSWLLERGATWARCKEFFFCGAAEGGSEEVLEWLLAHGCPMPVGVAADEAGEVVGDGE